ncbi:MAG: TIR domain-containing protein, partial [Saprospiraceae bacterium]
MSEPFKIFICYAREDQEALEMLRKKLVPLQSDGQVQLWYDREITGGKDWDEAIRFNLKTADLVLLLISDDFFDSDYINQVEMKEALAGHTRQENIVVPVILYDCVWEAHREIARLQALPADAKPVFETQHWRTPADGFNNVVRGVLRILDEPDTEARRARKNTRLESLRQAEARATAEAERIAKEKKAAEKHRQEKAKAEAERLAAEKKEKEAAEARNKALPGMVPVKGGTFQMGEKGVAEPIHTVTLSDFEIGQFPVTQKLWQEMMGNNPANFKGEDL